MSIRNCTALLLALSALLFLFGCGSSSPKAVPPPSGAFSNSSLSGSYTFSTLGFDAGGAFFVIAGTLTANGSGGITGGAMDVNDISLGPATNLAINNNSSYNVTADGRGTARLNTQPGTISFDFVLTSSSHGLITRFDSGGSGSGSLDLQTSTTLAGPYTFSLSGVDTGGTAPLAMAGTFTVTGSTISGTADINDSGFAFPETLSGSIALGSGTAPGTATLTMSSFPSFPTFTFDVYVIDSSHLKFVETDALPVLVGDVFAQQTSIPPGQLVFTAAGLDSTGAPMVTGGFMTSDGTSALTNGLQDVNDAGTVSPSQLAFSGSFTPASSGRSVFTLNTFFNGATGTFTFAAYSSTGGIQLLEIDSSGITTGAAFAQTSASFATPQGYGFNLSGSNSGGFEEDDIAEFTAANGNLTGLIDVNDEGSFKGNQTITGNYVSDGTNTGRGQITTTFVNGLYYTVDGSNVLFLETDSNQVGLGVLGLQTSPSAQAALVMSHFARVRPKASARAAWRHK